MNAEQKENRGKARKSLTAERILANKKGCGERTVRGAFAFQFGLRGRTGVASKAPFFYGKMPFTHELIESEFALSVALLIF